MMEALSSYHSAVALSASRSPRRTAVAVGAALLLTRLLYSWYTSRLYSNRLLRKQSAMKEKQATLRRILAQSPLSDDRVKHLTTRTLSKLQQDMRSGKTTPMELLHAFQTKALELSETGCNAIADFIDEAETWVQLLPSDMSSKPLYGIPISVKENVAVAGHDCTFGLVKRIGQSAPDDCAVVKALKEAGAIPFVVTSTSQGLISTDGWNPISGQMINPYGNFRTPGGSASGEAVLLAMGGSRIGFGTDLGGSIRIPGAYCALCCLKPTSGRVSTAGVVTLNTSCVGLHNTVGPMAKCVSDLVLVTKALLQPPMFRLDPTVVPLPFRERMFMGKDKKRLTIGAYFSLPDSDSIPLVPGALEAVHTAAALLHERGHRIVKFKPPSSKEAFELGLRSYFFDGGSKVLLDLKGEKLTKSLKSLSFMFGLSATMKRWVGVACKVLVGRPTCVLSALEGITDASATAQHLQAIQDYRAKFLNAWVEAGNLDAVICPPSAFPAPPIDAPSMYTLPAVAYTMLYNLVDYPAGVVPMGYVDRRLLIKAYDDFKKHVLTWDYYKTNVLSLQADSEGLPVAVQIVSRPWREEVVLRIMRELEENLEKYQAADPYDFGPPSP